MASIAQIRARKRIANASKATRRKWARKAAATRSRNALKVCRDTLKVAEPIIRDFAPHENPGCHHEEQLAYSQGFRHGRESCETASPNPRRCNPMPLAIGSNPELLVINPAGHRRTKGRITMKKGRRRKHKQHRIRYGRKLYSREALRRKFGKLKSRKIWHRKMGRKHMGKRGHRLSCNPKGSWMALVKKWGVKGAAKRRHHRRRHRR